MIESLKARWSLIFVVFFTALIWFSPNFIPDQTMEKMWWPSKDKLVMGLDIQGGLHLVLSVDAEEVVEVHAKKEMLTLKQAVKSEGINIGDVTVTPGDYNVTVKTMVGAGEVPKLVKYLSESNYGRAFQVLNEGPDFIETRFYDSYLQTFRKQLIQRSIETIRNRVDEMGVTEPSISAQGDDRILVQLPGLKDSEVNSAKDIINKTAKLEFMIVHEGEELAALPGWIAEAEKANPGLKLGEGGMKYGAYVKSLNKALKDKLPKDTAIRFQKPEGAETLAAEKVPYLLSIVNTMGGQHLTSAQQSYDQYGTPTVLFAMSGPGVKEMRDLTTTFKGKRMAIVLDGVVKSAPNLKSPIPNGSGQIEMGGGDRQTATKEAIDLSLVLRSGALPADLEQLEERTVGPTLGKDSIEKGKLAGLAGASLVFLFMLIYYKGFGLIANVALAFNILLVLAILTSLGATLTLPGVAGLALTIGMAVDANVIIYERIKEELAKGASLLASIREGYARAFWAIFDANITTAAVCVVLMYFGSGPIKGFAVTLICGLATSMFTAIFFTRSVLEYLVGKKKMKLSF